LRRFTYHSFALIAKAVVGFLVRYRVKRTKAHPKVTLFETLVIVEIAFVVSLIVGGIA
jgi:hypothetical protein